MCRELEKNFDLSWLKAPLLRVIWENCAKYFKDSRYVTLSPRQRWENWRSEKLSKSLNLTKSVNDGTGIQAQLCDFKAKEMSVCGGVCVC